MLHNINILKLFTKVPLKRLFILLIPGIFFLIPPVYADEAPDRPLGIGGGGAMSGFSTSPYSNVWFVGTDMGTLFRSDNQGVTWSAVNHFETTYGALLEHSAPVGFSSDPNVMFHAPEGLNPVMSKDSGITWQTININNNTARIGYWAGSSSNPDIIFAASDNGLYRTEDKGLGWQHITTTNGKSLGTFIDYTTTPNTVYHANPDGIKISTDGGITFTQYLTASIRWFAGGTDGTSITLAYIDRDITACPWESNCGWVWVSRNHGSFSRTNQYGGKQIVMAENDPDVIYVTGDRSWPNAYGTKVWVSTDAGNNWTLRFHQYNWDVVPYETMACRSSRLQRRWTGYWMVG